MATKNTQTKKVESKKVETAIAPKAAFFCEYV